MSDIFISYANEDQDRVAPIIKALETHGWAIWWDRRILPGKQFDLIIEEALERAKCIIVIWSSTSVTSLWVRGEATEGWQRGIVVPVMIDDVKPPLAFRQIQAAKLIGWQGQVKHPEFVRLVQAVTAIVDNMKHLETAEKNKYDRLLATVRNAERKLTRTEKMAISLENQNGITVFDIKGDFTALSEPFLNQAYWNACANTQSKILLKFSNDAYINSGGIAVLIQILAQTRRNNQIIGITGLSEHFKKVFHMVGISKFAKIYNTLEAALENM
jgi:anti-anti-sigma factor